MENESRFEEPKIKHKQMMWSSHLLVNCGSAGAFSHSAPFIRSPSGPPVLLLLHCCPRTRPPNSPSCAHTETLRHTPSWYQSNQSQWKSIIVLCHGNAPSCWNGVGWECTSRANITTVRFPHVEIWSVQGGLAVCSSHSEDCWLSVDVQEQWGGIF